MQRRSKRPADKYKKMRPEISFENSLPRLQMLPLETRTSAEIMLVGLPVSSGAGVAVAIAKDASDARMRKDALLLAHMRMARYTLPNSRGGSEWSGAEGSGVRGES